MEIDIGCRFSFKTISISPDLSLLAAFSLLKKAFSDTVEMQRAHHVPNSNTVNYNMAKEKSNQVFASPDKQPKKKIRNVIKRSDLQF